MFFFDGSKRKGDYYLTKEIGEYWQNIITDGRGRYFNVNGAKQYYQYDARGAVNYYDEQARKGLEHIATYFSKADYYIRLQLPQKLQGYQRRCIGRWVKGR